MKTFRIEQEHLRLLCSQVIRREKLKLKLLGYNDNLFRSKVEMMGAGG